MKPKFMIAAAMLLASAGSFAQAPQGSKRVTVLATGGTIAGAQAPSGGYGYKSGSFDINQLISAVPNLDKLAVITGEQVVNIGSQDMNNEVWLKLAKRLGDVVKSPETDAVLITHGTDTVEETGYFLNLVTKTTKPIVMVGSMRPATAISADGPSNLYNGVAAAISPGAQGRGVMVVLNDQIDYARNVVKMNTTDVQTFESINRGPAGVINTGAITWFAMPDKRQGMTSEFSVDGLNALPRVDIIYANAGMHPDLIDAAVKAGRQGLGDRRCRRRQHDRSRAGTRHCRGQGRRCRRPQHAASVGHCLSQQRSERRQARPGRVGRTQSSQVARVADAGADQDP